jgi:hypothetical protein
MPNLKRLVATGSERSETDYPPPLRWSDDATTASVRWIWQPDFTCFNPHTRERADHERRAPRPGDLEHADLAGKSCPRGPATYAAEPVHGLNVSDRPFTFLYRDVEKPAGVVWRQHGNDGQEGVPLPRNGPRR